MQTKRKNILEKPKSKIVTDDMTLLLKGRDAALVCGISLRTWRTWRTWDSMGYTPQAVYVGKSMFWRYRELEQWIDAGCPRREVWHYRDKSKK